MPTITPDYLQRTQKRRRSRITRTRTKTKFVCKQQ